MAYFLALFVDSSTSYQQKLLTRLKMITLYKHMYIIDYPPLPRPYSVSPVASVLDNYWFFTHLRLFIDYYSHEPFY